MSRAEMSYTPIEDVFWALSASKMHLRSELRPETRWRSLQRSPEPPLQRTSSPLSAFGVEFYGASETDFWLLPWVP